MTSGNQGDPQTTVPTWAEGKFAENLLERVKLSKAHYMATVIVFDKLMHTMVDTCGAK